MRFLLLCFCFLCSALHLKAGSDSLQTEKSAGGLVIDGFADVYYAFDFNQPASGNRQPFMFNHNRHNEVNLNLGFIRVGLENENYRAKLALHTGTYVNANYAAEPGVLKSIFEGNVGFSLNAKRSLWIDAGILPSHIGFESAVSIENTTLTRSILAENSPYFMSGVKLTYNNGKGLEMAGLALNGWQRIQRVPGNSLPSFGTQISYSPTDKFTFNWSSITGTDDPDSTRRLRVFNNFYSKIQLSKKLGIIAGFDIGMQQGQKHASNYHMWFSPVLIAQVKLHPKWNSALRLEYYHDENGVMIATGTPNGFQTSGVSLNFDYVRSENMMWRIEGRMLRAGDEIFERNGSPVRDNFFITTSIAVRLGGD
jgi:hypothetical protein